MSKEVTIPPFPPPPPSIKCRNGSRVVFGVATKALQNMSTPRPPPVPPTRLIQYNTAMAHRCRLISGAHHRLPAPPRCPASFHATPQWLIVAAIS